MEGAVGIGLTEVRSKEADFWWLVVPTEFTQQRKFFFAEAGETTTDATSNNTCRPSLGIEIGRVMPTTTTTHVPYYRRIWHRLHHLLLLLLLLLRSIITPFSPPDVLMTRLWLSGRYNFAVAITVWACTRIGAHLWMGDTRIASPAILVSNSNRRLVPPQLSDLCDSCQATHSLRCWSLLH